MDIDLKIENPSNHTYMYVKVLINVLSLQVYACGLEEKLGGDQLISLVREKNAEEDVDALVEVHRYMWQLVIFIVH